MIKACGGAFHWLLRQPGQSSIHAIDWCTSVSRSKFNTSHWFSPVHCHVSWGESPVCEISMSLLLGSCFLPFPSHLSYMNTWSFPHKLCRGQSIVNLPVVLWSDLGPRYGDIWIQLCSWTGWECITSEAMLMRKIVVGRGDLFAILVHKIYLCVHSILWQFW